MHAFFGADIPADTQNEQTASVGAQQDYQQFLASKNVVGASGQDAEAAQAAFFGVEGGDQSKAVKQLGEPIPGYSGCNRRIQADNVFGMTYAEARKMAGESLNKINQEKVETLKETSMWKGTKNSMQS